MPVPAWETLNSLEDRQRLAQLQGIQEFQAFLATLEAEVAQPVPPTLNNWLVQRAHDDGQLTAIQRIKGFFDAQNIQEKIEIYRLNVI